MTQKSVNGGYWPTPPLARHQILLLETCLEDRIPEDHPVRLLDEILHGLDWTTWENTYNRRIGQPPIHPNVLCSVLLFAMIRRIRSSRDIEYEIKHSIDFMWLVSGRTIDHSTISEFRRQNKAQVKDIHRQMIRVAVDMGAAQLSELCTDRSRMLAKASRFKTRTASRVEKLLAELDGQITKAMAEIETNDSIDDLFDDGNPADQLPPELAQQVARRDQMQAILEQLQQMDAARKVSGTNPQKNPAQLPKTDLDSRVLPNKEGGYAPKAAFVYDEEADCYHCPSGKSLNRKGAEKSLRAGGSVLQIVYLCDDCEGCSMAAQCRVNPESKRGRKVSHDEHRAARERHREQMNTPELQERYKQRQHFGETPFAVIKAYFQMRRCLLRGLEGVQAEWQWCCTAFNLKKLIHLKAALRAEQAENTKLATTCGT